MPRRPKRSSDDPAAGDWRGKTLRVLWRKADDPKPEFTGTDPHPDLKFTCECGFRSTLGPEHHCTKGAWPVWHVETR